MFEYQKLKFEISIWIFFLLISSFVKMMHLQIMA
jgi:hypothetical protein